jgi:hypothetical protein
VQLRWPAGPPWADSALPDTVKTSACKNLQTQTDQSQLHVRNQAFHVPRVSRMYLGQFLQTPHPVRSLGAQNVTLAGMSAQNFSVLRNLEALRRASMCLQL